MNTESRDLESDIIDLSGCSVEEIRALGIEYIGAAVCRALSQVCRPRPNFSGAGGGPTRAD